MAHRLRSRLGAAPTTAAVIALGSLLAACSSLLGIEDLSEDARDEDSAGTSGTASGGKGGSTGGSSGKGGSQGGTNASGASGSSNAGRGGGTSGSAGTGADGSGGSAAEGGNDGSGGSGATGGSGTAGDSNAGSAGNAGTGGGSSGPVNGTLVDFWHHPLPNVPVAIGEQETTTDENGEFSFADVPAEYDVSFIVRWESPTAGYGWVYQGLTRRDPTLQVFRGLEEHEVNVIVGQTGGTFGSGSQWLLAFGSDSGSRVSDADSAGFNVRPEWQGEASNDFTLHSLFFEQVASLPTAYTAYESQELNATVGSTPPDIEMDLSPQDDLDTGNVSGTVTNGTGEGRVNSAFIRFASGGALPIVDQVDASAAPFSYLMPSLPNGSVTVAAAEVGLDDSFAIVHRDELGIDATGVDLVIPEAASLAAPTSNTTGVDDTTTFRFQGGDPDVHAHLVHIEDTGYWQGIYIVTSRTEFTLGELPIVNGDFGLMANETHYWEVQAHGKPTSVDDMAGPNGFIDAFALDGAVPKGVRRDDGSYTRTKRSGFVTGP